MKAKFDMKTKFKTKIGFTDIAGVGFILLGIFSIFLVNRASAQSCDLSIRVENIQGSGSDTKHGFDFCSGCEKKYYLMYCSDSVTVKTSDSMGIFLPCGATWSCHSETINKDGIGGFEWYLPDGDPSACGVSYTKTSFTGGNAHSVSFYGTGPAGTPCGPDVTGTDSGSCYSESVNGVVVGGDPNGCNECVLYSDGAEETDYPPEITGDPCGGAQRTTSRTDYHYTGYNDIAGGATVTTVTYSAGYQNEYTTALAASKAMQCARVNLASQNQQWNEGNPSCRATVANDASSVGVEAARWRLALRGGIADRTYKIVLHWRVNGQQDISEKITVTSPGTCSVWYYPSEAGQELAPQLNVSCGCSYSKEMSQKPSLE